MANTMINPGMVPRKELLLAQIKASLRNCDEAYLVGFLEFLQRALEQPRHAPRSARPPRPLGPDDAAESTQRA